MKPPQSASQAPASQADVARGAGAAFLARLGAAVEVVAQPAYVALFGLPTYGLYMTLWAAVNLAQNIFDLGMPSALQRLVPQAKDESGAAAALKAALLLGVGLPLLVAGVAYWFAADLAALLNVAAKDREELVAAVRLYVWALPLWSVVEIGTGALRAKRVFGPEIRLRIFWEQVARLAIAGGLWLAGVRTLGLIGAHLLSLALTAGLTFRLLARHYPGWWRGGAPDGAVVGDALRSGVAVLPQDIVGRTLAEAPPLALNLLIPGAGGATAAGLYAIARKLSSLVQMVRMAFSYVMAPLASGAAAEGPDRIAPLYGFATRLSVAAAWPLAGAMLGAGPLLLSEPFGRAATAGSWAVAALVLARAVEAMTGQAQAIQQVTGARTAPLTSSLFGLAVAAGLAAWLIVPLGVTGAALAVAGGIVGASGMAQWQVWRQQGLHPFAAPFVRTAAVGLAVSGGAAAAGCAAQGLRGGVALIAIMGITLAAVWLSARLALPDGDKAVLGKAAKVLYLRSPA